ncbi:MAG: glycoside hydrolase family 2 [Alistipes sp.]|nr:glycoside hydrolase family 2 [Alistipes sp.]
MRISTFIMALSAFVAAEEVFAQKQPTLSSNFGLVAPQPADELPQAQTPPQQPVRKAKRTDGSRLALLHDGASWELAEGWELTEADNLVAAGESLFSPAFDTSAWYDAVVPGTVLTSLVEAGVYPDPYYGLNNMAIPESLCRTEWWYRIRFDRPAPSDGRRVRLRFEGINYRADVWLNGRKLGTIDGAFARGLFDVTEHFADENVLAVKIYPPHNPGIPHEQSKKAGRGPNGGQLCLDGPTFVSSEGWDWIPGIRDRNIGIWQGVVLEYRGDVTLSDPHVVTDLPLPDTSSADLTVSATLTNHAAEPRSVVLHGAIDGGIVFEKQVELAPGESRRECFAPADYPALHVVSPRLWWPNGYGAQELYTMTLAVDEGAGRSDTEQVRFGIRELSYELTVDAPSGEELRIDFDPTDDLADGRSPFDSFHRRDVGGGVVVPALRPEVDASAFRRLEKDGAAPFLVVRCNGVRIFCRGGNWGMDDGMKRVSRERLEPAFRLHAEEGFNMVRNWTGESTEELFYALCDEYGMLVWNDFWYSTEGYNQNPNDEDLFMANARETVLRFRNHPSLAIWCPRNEGYATPTLEVRLAELIASEDGTRLYSPNSRYMNLRTSGPWHYLADESEYFRDLAHGFSTELGTPSVPTAESMRKFMPETEQWPVSDTWHYHDLHFGLPEYVGAVDRLYGPAVSLDDFCRKVQLINYDSHRAMLEAWNSRMWNSTSGVLLWMSHPAWPSLEWQTYSWDFETHGSFYGCRKACEPVHVQMNPHDNRVLIVNTTRAALPKVRVRVTSHTPAGRRIASQTMSVDAVAANAVTHVGQAELPAGEACLLVRVELFAGGRCVSTNDYIRRLGDDFMALNDVPAAALRARKLALREADGKRTVRFEVSNSSPSTALAVKFNVRSAVTGEAVLPAYISEGYIHLLPNEKRVVEAEFAAPDDVVISAEGYNVERCTLLEL